MVIHKHKKQWQQQLDVALHVQTGALVAVTIKTWFL